MKKNLRSLLAVALVTCSGCAFAQFEKPPLPAAGYDKQPLAYARQQPEAVAARFREFKMRVEEAGRGGMDTTQAHRLAREADAALQSGDEQRCLTLLDEAIGLLGGSAPVQKPVGFPEKSPAPGSALLPPPPLAAGNKAFPFPALAQPYGDSPFGLETIGTPDDMNAVADLGAKWLYAIFFRWDEIQRDRRVARYDWLTPQKKTNRSYDQMVSRLPENIHMVGCLIFTDCDRSNPRTTYVPASVAEWTAFVKATVDRYNGDGRNDMPGLRSPIKCWQVDTEPEPGRKYGTLLEITYRAIKEADPEAVVIMGAMVCGAADPGQPAGSWCEPFYRDWVQGLTSRCFDVLDIHYYSIARGDYTRIKAVFDYWKAVVVAKGFGDIQFWSTGLGTYSGTPQAKVRVVPGEPTYHSEQFQAADLLKQYVYCASLGFRKVFLAMGLEEGYSHDGNYFDMTGLIFDGQFDHDRGKGVKKVGYFTYKMMTEKLEGSDWRRIESLPSGSPSVHAYRFWRSNGRPPVCVAWWDWFDEVKTIAGQSRTIDLPCSGAEAVVTVAITDYSGGRTLTRQHAVGGRVQVQLGEFPLFVE